MDEEVPYPSFEEVLGSVMRGVVQAQRALDEEYRTALAAPGATPPRFVIPRLELEYRTIFSVQKERTSEKRTLVVLGPKRIQEEKFAVEALSRVRVDVLAVPGDASARSE